MNTAVSNPFAAKPAARSETPMAQAKSSREASEVQAMVIMAKQFPRDPIRAMDRILNACTRPSLAEGAVYSYPRGGQNVEGPSIRLAEVLAQNWGNLDFGIRELSQENGESTVEAYAWDLETNVRQAKVFQVPHKRFTKKGSQTLTDPRDIYELIANNGSRRLRACILGVIPGDVVEAAQQQCSATLNAHADTSPEGIKAMLDALAPYGITADMLQTRYQCRLEAIRPAQVVELRKIYVSLRDGMSKPADWFTIETAPKAEDLNNIVGAAQPEPPADPRPSLTDAEFDALAARIIIGDADITEAAAYALTPEQQTRLDKL